jgi:hypothetical protein
MSVSVQPIKVVGLQHAMAELAAVDKRALKGFQDEYKQIVSPMMQTAKQLVPREAPMSGWARSWTPRSTTNYRILQRSNLLSWSANSANSIKPFTRRKRDAAVFGIRWTSKQAVLFDMTGKGSPKTEQGKRMQDVLRQRYGAPSRTMWRAYEQADSQIQRDMVNLINKIMKATGRNIQTRRFR